MPAGYTFMVLPLEQADDAVVRLHERCGRRGDEFRVVHRDVRQARLLRLLRERSRGSSSTTVANSERDASIGFMGRG